MKAARRIRNRKRGWTTSMEFDLIMVSAVKEPIDPACRFVDERAGKADTRNVYYRQDIEE